MQKQSTVQTVLNNRIAEIQVSYSHVVEKKDRISIRSPQMAVEVFRHMWDEELIDLIEHCYLLLLSRSNHVLGVVLLSKGGINCTIVDPKVIYGIALKSAASAIIIAHNHPSGNRIFSKPDIVLTKKLVEAGRLLDIALLDHIIMTKDSYASYCEEHGIDLIHHYQNKK